MLPNIDAEWCDHCLHKERCGKGFTPITDVGECGHFDGCRSYDPDYGTLESQYRAAQRMCAAQYEEIECMKAAMGDAGSAANNLVNRYEAALKEIWKLTYVFRDDAVMTPGAVFAVAARALKGVAK